MASALEDYFSLILSTLDIPPPQREYRFDPARRWRFDFAWPEQKIAIEIEGGTWRQGRHNRGAGFEGDCEKYNAATAAGWRVYRFTHTMIKGGYAREFIERIFTNERRRNNE